MSWAVDSGRWPSLAAPFSTAVRAPRPLDERDLAGSCEKAMKFLALEVRVAIDSAIVLAVGLVEPDADLEHSGAVIGTDELDLS